VSPEGKRAVSRKQNRRHHLLFFDWDFYYKYMQNSVYMPITLQCQLFRQHLMRCLFPLCKCALVNSSKIELNPSSAPTNSVCSPRDRWHWTDESAGRPIRALVHFVSLTLNNWLSMWIRPPTSRHFDYNTIRTLQIGSRSTRNPHWLGDNAASIQLGIIDYLQRRQNETLVYILTALLQK